MYICDLVKEWDKLPNLPTSTGGCRNCLHQHSRWLKLSSHFCRVMDACGILVWETHTLEILELNIIDFLVPKIYYDIYKLLWCIMIIRIVILIYRTILYVIWYIKNGTQRFLMIAPPIKEPVGSRDRPSIQHWKPIDPAIYSDQTAGWSPQKLV